MAHHGLASLDTTQYRHSKPLEFEVIVHREGPGGYWTLNYRDERRTLISMHLITSRQGYADQKWGLTPPGTYLIIKRKYDPPKILQQMLQRKFLEEPAAQVHPDLWFKLERLDESVGDDATHFNTVRREELRLHFGSLSLGCITLKDAAQYQDLVKALAAAKPGWFDPKTGRFSDKKTSKSIEYFGKIIIPPSGVRPR